MVNLEKILPTEDDESYVKHAYLIVVVWILITLLVALVFAFFTL
jgi:hypothetical protein